MGYDRCLSELWAVSQAVGCTLSWQLQQLAQTLHREGLTAGPGCHCEQ